VHKKNQNFSKSKKASVINGEFLLRDIKAFREFCQHYPESIREVEAGSEWMSEVQQLTAGFSTKIVEARSDDYFAANVWLECFEVKANALIGNENTLILDRVVDPQNFGAIIRTASFFGFNRIVIGKDHQALLSDSVVRVSRGGLAKVRIFVVPNLGRAIEVLKEQGHWVVGGALDGAPIGSGSVQPGSDVALVVGSEEKGIRPGIVAKCDETILISSKSGEVGLESLNVSVAAGILCAYYKGVLSKK